MLRMVGRLNICLSIVLLILVAPKIHSQAGCYNGDYTIGSSASDNFVNLQEAFDSLTLYSMCGPVTLKIKNGTYTGTNSIGAIPGNNTQNPLIIKSFTGIASNVILQKSGSATISTNYVLKIDGTSNIQLENLTLKRTGSANEFNTVISIIDTSQIIKLTDLVINAELSNSTNLMQVSGHKDTLMVESCTFSGGTGSISAVLSSALYFKINNSSFSNVYGSNLSIPNNANFIDITNNTFTTYGSQTVSALYAVNCSADVRFAFNTVSSTITSSLIYTPKAVYFSCPVGASNTISIYNNYINCTGLYTDGIVVNNADSVYCLFNTINTKERNLEFTGTSFAQIKNNILLTTGGTPLYANQVGSLEIDYNCYSGYSQFANIEGIGYANFTNFTQNTSFDQNSLEHPPVFVSGYVIQDIFLDGLGLPIPDITTDIEGTIRSNTPDMGCYEFTPPQIEAKLIQVVDIPTNVCEGSAPISCIVANLGQLQIDSIQFKLTINNVDTFINWTGTILSLDTVQIDLSIITFERLGVYNITAVIDSVNGQLDEISNNNQDYLPTIRTRMTGGFTVNRESGDFMYYFEAIQALNAHLTCDNVFIYIEQGVNGFPTNQAETAPQLNGLNQDTIWFLPQYTPVNGIYSTRLHVRINISNCANIYYKDIVLEAYDNDITYSSNIRFQNVWIVQEQYSLADTFQYNSPMNMLGLDSVYFEGCKITDGDLAMKFETCDYVFVDNCHFIGQTAGSIDFTETCNNALIINSEFNLKETYATRVIRTNNFNGFRIENNVFMVGSGRALGFGYSFLKKNTIANNSFSTGNSDLVSCANVDSLEIFGNSFYSNTTNAVIQFDDELLYSNYVEMKNNLFKNVSGYVFGGYFPINSLINNNAYSSSNFGFHANYSSLSAWNGLGFDNLNVITSFNFVGSHDLHVDLSPSLSSGAYVLTDYPFDLDSRERDAQPSYGAYELEKDNIDIGLLANGITQGVCGAQNNQELWFTNSGPDILTEATFLFRPNATDSIFVQWEGLLSIGDTGSVALGIIDNLYEIGDSLKLSFVPKTWQNDLQPFNNSFGIPYVVPQMQGIFTVGTYNSDFLNLDVAFKTLSKRGICDSTVLKLQSPYHLSFHDAHNSYGSSVYVLDSVPGISNNHLLITSEDSTVFINKRIHVVNNSNVTIDNIGTFADYSANNSNYYSVNSFYDDLFSPSTIYNGIIISNSVCLLVVNSSKVSIKNSYFQSAGWGGIRFHGICNDINILDNEFIGVDFVCRIPYNSTCDSIFIIGNKAGNQPYYQTSLPYSYDLGVGYNSNGFDIESSLYYIENVPNIVFEANTITDNTLQSITLYIVDTVNLQNSFRINNNIILNRFKIISKGQSNSRNTIYNNLFRTGGSGSLVLEGSYFDFYHNTISSSLNSSVVIVNNPNFTNRLEKNLITQYAALNLGWSGGLPALLDNNCYAVTIPSNNLQNGYDLNSIINNVPLVSNFDPHLLLPNSNIPRSLDVISCPYDFDYEPRVGYTVYGADEIPINATLDGALINMLEQPISCSDSIIISVIVANQGLDTLTDLSIDLNINQVSSNYTFSGLFMVPYQTDTLVFNAISIQEGTNYDITADILTINGVMDTIYLNNIISTVYNYQPDSNTVAVHLCSNETYLLGSAEITTAGVYSEVLTNSFGCDSLVVCTVSTSIDSTYASTFVCFGDSLEFNGAFYTQPGLYNSPSIDNFGCNVMNWINITMNSSETQYEQENFHLCWGDSLLIADDYVFLGGTYFDSILGAQGCDSIITQFSITQSGQPEFESSSICFGESLAINGIEYNTPGSYQYVTFDSYNCPTQHTHELIIQNPINTAISIQGNSLIATNNNNYQYQWVLCDNYQPIISANNYSFNPISENDYAVIITSQNCMDTSICVDFSINGLNDLKINTIKCYPNPAIDYLKIESNFDKLDNVEVLDAIGKCLLRIENSDLIDISNLASGSYIVLVKVGLQEFKGHFVKTN